MSDQQSILETWSSTAISIVDNYLDLTSPYLLDKPVIDSRTQWILRYLAASCNQTTNSALLLVAYGELWDAEILLRSVIEGTIKYVYLCSGSEEEYKTKAEEFLVHLPEIDKIRQQYRVKAFLQEVDDPNNADYAILQETIISETELRELRNRYPRSEQRRLKQKWSFNEIARVLAQNSRGLNHFDALRYLLSYTYGIGSHLAHQDATALMLIHERLRKDPDDAALDRLAHASRLINDLLMMSSFRAAMTLALHDSDVQPVMSMFESHQDFVNEMTSVRRDWWAHYSTRS